MRFELSEGKAVRWSRVGRSRVRWKWSSEAEKSEHLLPQCFVSNQPVVSSADRTTSVLDIMVKIGING